MEADSTTHPEKPLIVEPRNENRFINGLVDATQTAHDITSMLIKMRLKESHNLHHEPENEELKRGFSKVVHRRLILCLCLAVLTVMFFVVAAFAGGWISKMIFALFLVGTAISAILWLERAESERRRAS